MILDFHAKAIAATPVYIAGHQWVLSADHVFACLCKHLQGRETFADMGRTRGMNAAVTLQPPGA